MLIMLIINFLLRSVILNRLHLLNLLNNINLTLHFPQLIKGYVAGIKEHMFYYFLYLFILTMCYI